MILHRLNIFFCSCKDATKRLDQPISALVGNEITANQIGISSEEIVLDRSEETNQTDFGQWRVDKNIESRSVNSKTKFLTKQLQDIT